MSALPAALPNKALEAGGARRLRNEFFVSAPQLKRDPLGIRKPIHRIAGTAMKDLLANSLLPFVPSGQDYDASRRLFADLGFEERWESDGYAGFRNGGAEFILQRFDDEHFAQNFMVRLNVDDLDRWWEIVSQKGLDRTYPGVRFSGPTDQPWGREINFIDLAGVCWHIGQRE